MAASKKKVNITTVKGSAEILKQQIDLLFFKPSHVLC